MELKDFSLLRIKHEINNILFKLETSSEILLEENISKEEYKEVASILKENIGHLKLLFENMFILETIKNQKKEKINLQDFLGFSLPKRCIEGFPLALSKALQNLKDISAEFEIYEKNGKIFVKIKDVQDKFLKYILYITEYLFKINQIEVIKEVKD